MLSSALLFFSRCTAHLQLSVCWREAPSPQGDWIIIFLNKDDWIIKRRPKRMEQSGRKLEGRSLQNSPSVQLTLLSPLIEWLFWRLTPVLNTWKWKKKVKGDLPAACCSTCALALYGLLARPLFVTLCVQVWITLWCLAPGWQRFKSQFNPRFLCLGACQSTIAFIWQKVVAPFIAVFNPRGRV